MKTMRVLKGGYLTSIKNCLLAAAYFLNIISPGFKKRGGVIFFPVNISSLQDLVHEKINF
jgi:hypothetical protein